jgi:hypothetical protein
MFTRQFLFGLLTACLASALGSPGAMADEPPLRIGIIGCDTPHSTDFTKIIHNPDGPPELKGLRVVAAFAADSDDIPESIQYLPGCVETLRKEGVEIVDSIPALLERVDVVMVESLDGRKHLEQARPVIAAGKTLFVDKPVGGDLAEAIEIFRLAAEKKVPCFSSSSLRFSPGIAAMRSDPKVGQVLGCSTYGPCATEPHHPDLFWYGVHGVEMLFTIMGPGCQTVACTHTADTDLVVGVWTDGRIGSFRGLRSGPYKFGSLVFGSAGIQPGGEFAGYEPLVVEVAKFFRSGKPPVSAEETIEIFAFMQAADESKKQGGQPIELPELIAKTRQAGVPMAKTGGAGN